MKRVVNILNALLLISSISCNKTDNSADNRENRMTSSVKVSGNLANGLREIIIEPSKKIYLKVFAGDYIVLAVKDTEKFTIEIKELGILKTYPTNRKEPRYIKMKQPGTFAIAVGDKKGAIEVIEYTDPHYKVVSSTEAREIIKNIEPLILDVRTPQEHNSMHIPGSKLIPVQILSQELSNLEKYKTKDILIYCATGNRSTVASKILIDNGFKKIYNLQRGIADWSHIGLPTKHN